MYCWYLGLYVGYFGVVVGVLVFGTPIWLTVVSETQGYSFY